MAYEEECLRVREHFTVEGMPSDHPDAAVAAQLLAARLLWLGRALPCDKANRVQKLTLQGTGVDLSFEGKKADERLYAIAEALPRTENADLTLRGVFTFNGDTAGFGPHDFIAQLDRLPGADQCGYRYTLWEEDMITFSIGTLQGRGRMNGIPVSELLAERPVDGYPEGHWITEEPQQIEGEFTDPAQKRQFRQATAALRPLCLGRQDFDIDDMVFFSDPGPLRIRSEADAKTFFTAQGVLREMVGYRRPLRQRQAFKDDTAEEVRVLTVTCDDEGQVRFYLQSLE